MMIKTFFLILGGYFWTADLPGVAQQVKKSTASVKTPVTVSTLEQSLAKRGGKATVAKYLCAQNPATDDFTALNKISAGSKEWVDLAVKMLPYSDAGCSESIQSSLGDAMQKQPRNVLPYVGKTTLTGPDRICMPFISNEIPESEQLQAVRRSKTALLAVHDKALEKPCQTCLTAVNKLEKIILADMAKKKK